MVLAHPARNVFCWHSVVRSGHRQLSAASQILAGMLAVALLVLELLAADGDFHCSLHKNRQTTSAGCVLCMFVQGQVDLAQPAPVIPAAIRSVFEIAPRFESITGAHFTYLAAPSRAPPAPASLPSVVG
jgi:hypothetical protein